MTYFDNSNWKYYKIHYIVIAIIVIIILVYIHSCQEQELRGSASRARGDGNGDIYYLGRGNIHDEVNTLVDRTQWCSYLDKRVTFWQRIFVATIVAMIFVILLAMRKLPTPGGIVILFFCIFVPVYAVHQLFYVHGDVYNDYYIKTNMELIRDKLGFEKSTPPDPIDNIPDRPFVMTKIN